MLENFQNYTDMHVSHKGITLLNTFASHHNRVQYKSVKGGKE